jgi:hypothetical protein
MFELIGYLIFMLLGLTLDQTAKTFRQAVIAIFILFAATFCFMETLVIQGVKLLWYIVA